MTNYEQTKYNFDAANLTDIQGVNTGLIIPWSSSSVPSGFLECDGAAVSRTTYAALFSIVGTSYGSGDGSTTFNVPDLTDRICVHKSPTKTQFTAGGANTVTTLGNVAGSLGNTTLDTPEIPSHTHTSSPAGNNPASENYTHVEATASIPYKGGSTSGSTGGSGAHSHPLSANFTGGSDSVVQPFTAIKYIIKT